MNTIHFDEEARKYWREHSGILEDLLEEEDEVTRDLMLMPDTQFDLLKDLVEGGPAFTFKKGIPYPNPKKGYTKNMLITVLDYIDFEDPRTMLPILYKNIPGKQLNAPGATVPRGKGTRKAQKVVRSYARNNNYNNNNSNNNNKNNNNKNKKTLNERVFENHNNTHHEQEISMMTRLSKKQEKNLATTRRKKKDKKGKRTGYSLNSAHR